MTFVYTTTKYAMVTVIVRVKKTNRTVVSRLKLFLSLNYIYVYISAAARKRLDGRTNNLNLLVPGNVKRKLFTAPHSAHVQRMPSLKEATTLK